MRRHTENSSDLIDLELARLKELRLFRGYGDGRVFESLFQNGDLAAVLGASELAHPGLPDPLRIFNRAGVFKNAARSRPVGEELATVLLCGDGETDGVLRHCDRTVSDETVEAQSGDVKHVGRTQDHGFISASGFVCGALILVVQMTPLVTVDVILFGMSG